jgi:hypothetical protein
MGRRFALLGLRQSYLSTGTETPAFWTFLVCHIGASTLTWSALRAAGRRTYTRTCVAAANCGGADQDMTAPGGPGGMGKGSLEFCLVAERTRRHPPSDESNYGMGCGGRKIASTETWRG